MEVKVSKFKSEERKMPHFIASISLMDAPVRSNLDIRLYLV